MISRSPVDLENSSPAGKCTLSSDVKIKGSITFQKELLLDGKVQGKINSDGVLTIGENADIRGEIKVKSVTVYGYVHGNITAERCELKSTCTLEGDLKAPRLIIEEGATFIGTSQNALAGTVETPEIASDGKPSGSSQTGRDNLSTQKQTRFWR
jgi:cytoskeletal protein CcmA (bactofilin family)